jgi:biopolymer transport protein ExbD
MPLKTEPLESPSLNLTPMIDVLFQLIIFFMVGTQFVGSDHQIDVDVPSVSDAPTASADPARRVVVLRADGQVELDGQVVTLAQLRQRLMDGDGRSSAAGIMVLGDRRGSLQNLAEVLQACSTAGVRDIGLGVARDETIRR